MVIPIVPINVPVNTRASKKVGVSDEQWAKLFGLDIDEPDVDTLYRNTPWDYRATTICAWMTSRVPYQFYKGKRKVSEESLPFINKPNWRKLLYLISGSLSQHGAAYIGIVRNVDGDPLELVWLSATRTHPEWTKEEEARFGLKTIKGWRRDYTNQAKGSKLYGYDDIVHIWLPSFTDEADHDVSPSMVSSVDSQAMMNASQYIGSYFKRGTIQPTILTVPDDTREEAIGRLERWWDQIVEGVQNAWRTVGLRAGVEVHKLGDKPSDLAIDELTASTKVNVGATHGVPDAMLSGKDVNYASGQAQRLNLIEHTIKPRCEFIAEGLNDRLLGPYGNRIEFQFQELEIYRRLQEKRGTALSPLVQKKIITRKELRKMIDMPPEIPEDMKDPEWEKEHQPIAVAPQNGDMDEKEQLMQQEVKQYKKKVESKGVGVRFDSRYIPREMRYLMDEYMRAHPEDPFGWMRAENAVR